MIPVSTFIMNILLLVSRERAILCMRRHFGGNPHSLSWSPSFTRCAWTIVILFTFTFSPKTEKSRRWYHELIPYIYFELPSPLPIFQVVLAQFFKKSWVLHLTSINYIFLQYSWRNIPWKIKLQFSGLHLSGGSCANLLVIHREVPLLLFLFLFHSLSGNSR